MVSFLRPVAMREATRRRPIYLGTIEIGDNLLRALLWTRGNGFCEQAVV
jgi:hypothetical protein